MNASLKCMLIGGALFALATGSASAAVILETEPNDTLAGAQVITSLDPTLNIQGARTFDDPSDDFFSFLVQAPGVLRITASSPDAAADSIMGLFGPGGTLLASNDDGAGGFMSAIEWLIAPGATGAYAIGFSGFNPGLLVCTGAVTECYDTDGDFVFDTFVAGGGSGGSTGWDYTITVVQFAPEPHSLALLALALPAVLVLDRRRARRTQPRRNLA